MATSQGEASLIRGFKRQVAEILHRGITQTALATVGFSSEEQFEVFRVVAAILHVGNIEIKGDRSDQAYITSPEVVEKVCHLLGVSSSDFSRAVLKPKVKAGREIVTQARTKRQADEELGALCKHMYEKAFGGLVDRINKALDRPALKSQVSMSCQMGDEQ